MYFLSGNRRGSKYGVVDTEDGIEDFLTISELLVAESRGLKVYGLFRKNGYLYCFGLTLDAVNLLKRRVPVAVRVRIAHGLGFTQMVYMGHRVTNTGDLEFVFFDDSGMSGLCILTNMDFISGGVGLDFFNIDQRRASVLMRRLQDSGGFVL